MTLSLIRPNPVKKMHLATKDSKTSAVRATSRVIPVKGIHHPRTSIVQATSSLMKKLNWPDRLSRQT
jgi:hypothetical protein